MSMVMRLYNELVKYHSAPAAATAGKAVNEVDAETFARQYKMGGGRYPKLMSDKTE